MKTVDRMLIMDVDGVITDPKEKRITEPEILDEIVKRLEKGEPVGLNTGRSLVWMIDRVINPLLEKVKDKKTLKNFFASGEKGGTWITFDGNGEMQHHKDGSISVPESLQDKVRNLINSEFSESMFYDETKETMISTEMKDGYPIEEYSNHQIILNEKLQKLVDEDSSGKPLKVDPTTIATDIENKHVGKGFAVERMIEWLKNLGIEPQRFVTFGDSLSDIPMAEKLRSLNKKVELAFVGKSEIKKSFPFPIIRPKKFFGKGTLEVLRSL
ncbi:MAG: HAD hydrolase family protein [Nanoarchaeota archaeon]|nr:HAD hydrolase family protein [Nanoarchaeota archaeon]